VRIVISDKLVNRRANERSAVAFTARFYDDSTDTWSTTTPTTVKYRVDDLESGSALIDWTSATPGTSVTITATAASNAIQNDCNREERRQLTVKADDGLATQWQETKTWWVRNLSGQV
jgi:hypothetical protein